MRRCASSPSHVVVSFKEARPTLHTCREVWVVWGRAGTCLWQARYQSRLSHPAAGGTGTAGHRAWALQLSGSGRATEPARRPRRVPRSLAFNQDIPNILGEVLSSSPRLLEV